MALGRPYIAPIHISASFSAAIDIFELGAASGKPLMLMGFEFGQTTEVGDAQEEQMALVLKRCTGSFTSGSGGGTSTFRPQQPNDAAAGATLETGNTTKAATGSGTIVDMLRLPWNVRASCLYVPIPEDRIVLDASTSLVLELLSTPADSIGGTNGVIGWISIEELV